MEATAKVLMIVGFLCALPIGWSMAGHWTLGTSGRGKLKLQGPIVRNIERKTWHIRLFILGAGLFAVGALLLMLARA